MTTVTAVFECFFGVCRLLGLLLEPVVFYRCFTAVLPLYESLQVNGGRPMAGTPTSVNSSDLPRIVVQSNILCQGSVAFVVRLLGFYHHLNNHVEVQIWLVPDGLQSCQKMVKIEPRASQGLCYARE